MFVDHFISQRQDDWSRLAELLEYAQAGLDWLSAEELEELGRLYQVVTSDLAVAQRDYPGQSVTSYLNHLVGQTHALMYRDPGLGLRRVVHFFTVYYPQLFRRRLPFILAAFALLVTPASLAFYATSRDPGTADLFGLEEPAQILERHRLWTEIPIEERPGASSFIMTNNIRIAFLAFGGGMTFGLLTLYILLQNGLLLGGVFGLAQAYGMAPDLATFVVGHGVIELSVIFIAGGAGLYIGWSLLHPGPYSRQDALAEAARDSVRLLAGCVPLLVIAGTIEGFLSPSSLPPVYHYATGAVTGVLLYGYLLGAGREI